MYLSFFVDLEYKPINIALFLSIMLEFNAKTAINTYYPLQVKKILHFRAYSV